MSSLAILVEPNGSGKSNFLDALGLVADALNTSLDHALRARGGRHRLRGQRLAGDPGRVCPLRQGRLGASILLQCREGHRDGTGLEAAPASFLERGNKLHGGCDSPGKARVMIQDEAKIDLGTEDDAENVTLEEKYAEQMRQIFPQKIDAETRSNPGTEVVGDILRRLNTKRPWPTNAQNSPNP